MSRRGAAWRATRPLAAALCAFALLALAPAAATAAPPADELAPERDNGAAGSCGRPCTSAPGEEVPPPRACAGARSLGGSWIERRLPAGPLRADGSLAFTSGICVYLPPGYGDGKLRYPVIYLLHGGGGDQADWPSKGAAQRILDDAAAADTRDAAIVVMPDATECACWFDRPDGTALNERYMLDHVLPYVDRHYRTIADRRGRAIVGLSNGGHGTMYLAATAPDRFAAAAGMSANVGWQSFVGGAELDRSGSPAYFNGHLPRFLAGNLDGLDVMLDIGARCAGDLVLDACTSFVFEQVFLGDNRDFVAALREVAHAGAVDYRETEGGHAWRWWQHWLTERQLPFLLARLADPQPAARRVRPSAPRLPFRYRSIAPSFSVYGYEVVVQRGVREFLGVADVDRGGLRVRGSGAASIRTAPIYARRARYRISGEAGAGAPPRIVRADRRGRLALAVDLGPAHAHEQFTEAQREAERAGGYWSERSVRIERVRRRAR